MSNFIKDPQEILDYSINWADWLGTETISTSEWTVPSGITSVNEWNTTTDALIRLGGGTVGSIYRLLNHIVTSGGQESERVLIIEIRDLESEVADQLDLNNAISIVTDLVEIDTEPSLTEAEVERQVKLAKLASTWQPNTFYRIGSVVVIDPRNNHAYESIQPGTSQSGARSYSEWPIGRGATFGDGSTSPQLIWQDVGTDIFNSGHAEAQHNVYDIELGKKRCWLLKAAKASEMIQTGDLAWQQVYDHCMEQASRCRPFRRQIQLIRG